MSNIEMNSDCRAKVIFKLETCLQILIKKKARPDRNVKIQELTELKKFFENNNGPAEDPLTYEEAFSKIDAIKTQIEDKNGHHRGKSLRDARDFLRHRASTTNETFDYIEKLLEDQIKSEEKELTKNRNQEAAKNKLQIMQVEVPKYRKKWKGLHKEIVKKNGDIFPAEKAAETQSRYQAQEVDFNSLLLSLGSEAGTGLQSSAWYERYQFELRPKHKDSHFFYASWKKKSGSGHAFSYICIGGKDICINRGARDPFPYTISPDVITDVTDEVKGASGKTAAGIDTPTINENFLTIVINYFNDHKSKQKRGNCSFANIETAIQLEWTLNKLNPAHNTYVRDRLDNNESINDLIKESIEDCKKIRHKITVEELKNINKFDLKTTYYKGKIIQQCDNINKNIKRKIKNFISEKRSSWVGGGKSIDTPQGKAAFFEYLEALNKFQSDLKFMKEDLVQEASEEEAETISQFLDEDYQAYALHIAAQSGNAEIVKLLLEHGAEVDAKNKYGESALHVAARSGNAEIVELLLTHGADLTLSNNANFTALDIACESNSQQSIYFLTSHISIQLGKAVAEGNEDKHNKLIDLHNKINNKSSPRSVASFFGFQQRCEGPPLKQQPTFR